MQQLRILLVCGSGASSGFMAANIRKAAAARGLETKIVARGESEIENYIDDIDVLMVGPHLAYILDEVDDYVGDAPVKVILMRPDYYSTLDGNAAVDHLLAEVGSAGIGSEGQN
ncbi:MAG: PTS sugar transporter subunit IIB [Propionibacteriaceae bacterium]|mgnify:CR=1 FL=1|jgi:PTS system cellobiose-specific IIB component|nr:PTS sugar transporter subunit IIB [Propionibacteriaceae bacterium]